MGHFHEQVRQISEMIASGIQPLQNLRVIFKFPEEERVPWCKAAIEHGFQGWCMNSLELKRLWKYEEINEQ